MKVNNENTILHPFTFIMEMPLGVPQDVKGQSLTEIMSLNNLADLLSTIII
jgi:hypothetical protein